MRAEWISVEIREHTTRGTMVHRGLFPQAAMVTMQCESMAAIIAQVTESLLQVHLGHVIEMEISYSEPTTIELDEEEANLMASGKKDKGSKRWKRHFVGIDGTKEVTNGKGS